LPRWDVFPQRKYSDFFSSPVPFSHAVGCQARLAMTGKRKGIIKGLSLLLFGFIRGNLSP